MGALARLATNGSARGRSGRKVGVSANRTFGDKDGRVTLGWDLDAFACGRVNKLSGQVCLGVDLASRQEGTCAASKQSPKTPMSKRSAKSFRHREIDQARDQVPGHQRGQNRITERSSASLRRSREGCVTAPLSRALLTRQEGVRHRLATSQGLGQLDVN